MRSTKLRLRCRRCFHLFPRMMLVHNAAGVPTDLCLKCEAHDKIKQEEFRNERAHALN